MIDIENAKKIYKEYSNNYDLTNPKITLKIAHTYRVSELSKKIATEIGENEENIEIATLIGLLHDIGRLEQLKRYNSFNDKSTINHAELGIEILTENESKLLKKFCENSKYYPIIIKAIENHNKYKIDSNIIGKELTQCKIIRDADKIDILSLYRYEKYETLYGVSEIADTEINDNLYNSLFKGIGIQGNEKIIITPMDKWIYALCFIFDINYKASFIILRKANYINALIDRVENKNNKEKLEKVREFLNKYIEDRC